MLLLCKQCTYPNLPIETLCAICGSTIQSKEDAAENKELWDTLPEQVRKEFEAKYKSGQQRYHSYLKFLKRNLKKHILLGALINCVFSFVSYLHSMPMPWLAIYLVLALITGGITGWMLNYKKGGRFTGVIIFSGAYFILLLINGLHMLSVGVRPEYISIWWIFQGGSGFVLNGGVGYFIGLKLEMDRFNQWL